MQKTTITLLATILLAICSPAHAGDRKKARDAILAAGAKMDLDYSALYCDSKTDMDAVLKQIHHFPGTWRLNLKGVGTDEHLKKFEVVEELAFLDLLGTPVTDKGMKSVARFKKLRNLALYDTKITDAGLKEISNPLLRWLALNGTEVTDKGLSHLVGMKSLDTLSLSPRVTDEGLKEIAKMTQLRCLLLPGASITGKGLENLAPLGATLYELGLNSDKIVDDDLKKLGGLPNLYGLSLRCPKITDKGIDHILLLKKVSGVMLPGTQVTDKGMLRLAVLPNLRQLDVLKTKVTQAGIEEMRKLRRDVTFIEEMPKMNVSFYSLYSLPTRCRARTISRLRMMRDTVGEAEPL